jgi:hypothetical protein
VTPPTHDIDATAEEHRPPSSTDLAVVDHSAVGTYLRAATPVEIITKATEIANALKTLVEAQNLTTDVGGGKKHLDIGGWQACGALVGALGGQSLHAETVWTRRIVDEDGRLLRTRYHVKETRYYRKRDGGGPRETVEYDVDGFDWEARVEIHTAAGAVVASAEGMCGRGESTWARRPDYALRGMAETRAESRAYRRAIGWLVNIAGYIPGGPDETADHAAAASAPAAPTRPGDFGITQEQCNRIAELWQASGLTHESFHDELDRVGAPENENVAKRVVSLTAAAGDQLIATLTPKHPQAAAS